jgi:hypothetical protein
MSINFDRMREIAKETPKERKRRKWQELKALQPTGGVRVAIGIRKKYPCTCTPVRHTRKHHKKTGRCRPGCDCKAGMR